MGQHPLMQRIGKGFGFGLPDFPPHIRWQIFGFPLDLVESTDVFQGLGRQFALVGLVQVIELAPGVGHTADFGNAVAEPGLVASVIITDQLAPPVTRGRFGRVRLRLGAKS